VALSILLARLAGDPRTRHRAVADGPARTLALLIATDAGGLRARDDTDPVAPHGLAARILELSAAASQRMSRSPTTLNAGPNHKMSPVQPHASPSLTEFTGLATARALVLWAAATAVSAVVPMAEGSAWLCSGVAARVAAAEALDLFVERRGQGDPMQQGPRADHHHQSSASSSTESTESSTPTSTSSPRREKSLESWRAAWSSLPAHNPPGHPLQPQRHPRAQSREASALRRAGIVPATTLILEAEVAAIRSRAGAEGPLAPITAEESFLATCLLVHTAVAGVIDESCSEARSRAIDALLVCIHGVAEQYVRGFDFLKFFKFFFPLSQN
jgi:hypothetical protein